MWYPGSKCGIPAVDVVSPAVDVVSPAVDAVSTGVTIPCSRLSDIPGTCIAVNVVSWQ